MIFFFSSRRRHTRWPRDWSSDVCSSDLELGELEGPRRGRSRHVQRAVARKPGRPGVQSDLLAEGCGPGAHDLGHARGGPEPGELTLHVIADPLPHAQLTLLAEPGS